MLLGTNAHLKEGTIKLSIKESGQPLQIEKTDFSGKARRGEEEFTGGSFGTKNILHRVREKLNQLKKRNPTGYTCVWGDEKVLTKGGSLPQQRPTTESEKSPANIPQGGVASRPQEARPELIHPQQMKSKSLKSARGSAKAEGTVLGRPASGKRRGGKTRNPETKMTAVAEKKNGESR